MNSVKYPPVHTNGVGHGHDELGDALRAFFRSEMPQPWPPLKKPVVERAVAPFPPPAASTKSWPRRWFLNSRTALAASLGVLILGYLLLSDTLKPTNNVDPKDPTANGRLSRPGAEDRNLMPAPPDVEDPDVILDESLILENGKTTMKFKVTPKKRG